MNTYKQFTIREGLILVFVAGFAVASLSVGGIVASLFLIFALVLVTAFAISAFVGREDLRTYAIGFVLPVFLYSLILFAFGASEFNPHNGKLPTTNLMGPLFEGMVKLEYVDKDGNVVQDYDPAKKPTSGGGFGTPTIYPRQTPNRITFMSIAHTILAMLAGYLGGKFAQFISKDHSKDPTHGE